MELDPRLTFETFVVGPANRLASAAAHRAAESPGTSYNPLFLYSASGLGKSHILTAIGHQALRAHPEWSVVYQTLEGHLEELAAALKRGDAAALRGRYQEADILLLDDIQFLMGQPEAQEMLLRTIDILTSRGGQVVLASDRPPAEIDGLDARLLSRFSGGLIVDIGLPDYETRVAIVRRKVEERDGRLATGVAEALARFSFRNVRELQGALNRVLAIQEIEDRAVGLEELEGLVGEAQRGTAGGDAGAAEARGPEGEADWRRAFRKTAEAVEATGFSVRRLRRTLEAGTDAEGGDWRETLRAFRRDVDRLREIRREMDTLGNPWPAAAANLLRDPDRLDEAESLLESARERARPFPSIPPGPELERVAGDYPPMAVRAAERTVSSERPDYSPLYLHTSDGERARRFLEATARTFRARHPEGRVGMVTVTAFAGEFIRAVSEGVAGAWRERWWSLELLILLEAEGLASTERAQEEFFHLFEALTRSGGRMIVSADRAPGRLEGVEDRLRSRFEGGLVVDLGRSPEDMLAGVEMPAATDPDDVLSELRAFAGVPSARDGEEASDGVATLHEGDPSPEVPEDWRPSPEKVVWTWRRVEDRVSEADR